MKPQYLRVRNWERFQHYTNRRPPWVKYHVELLDDYELLHLPLPSQLVFDRLLLLAARTDNNIPNDPEHIGRQITIEPETVRDAIERLLSTDHLVVSERKRAASKAIARRKQSATTDEDRGGTETETETETEEETETETERVQAAPAPPEPDDENEPGQALVPLAGGDARTLVAAFVDEARQAGLEPPRRTVGHLAAEVGRLLKEGQSPDAVAAGLARMVRRGLVIPSALPNFVMEAQLPARPSGPSGAQRYGRGVSTETILDMAARAAAEEREAS